jgi:hypothetical protein
MKICLPLESVALDTGSHAPPLGVCVGYWIYFGVLNGSHYILKRLQALQGGVPVLGVGSFSSGSSACRSRVTLIFPSPAVLKSAQDRTDYDVTAARQRII